MFVPPGEFVQTVCGFPEGAQLVFDGVKVACPFPGSSPSQVYVLVGLGYPRQQVAPVSFIWVAQGLQEVPQPCGEHVPFRPGKRVLEPCRRLD